MKNFVIVFLSAWVIYLLLGKKRAAELAQQAQDKIQGIRSVISQELNGPGGEQPTTVGPEALHITQVHKPGDDETGRSPLIDRPLIMDKGSQIKVYNDAFANFTTGSKLGIFKKHEGK